MDARHQRHFDIANALLGTLQGATYEYPGLVVFPDAEGRLWGTGLNGWDYATPQDGSADVLLIAATDDATPEQIAGLWHRFQQGA